jgi:hypothetical protein
MFCHSTGPLIKYERGFLFISDLNPEMKTKWRMSRGEMLRVGWRFLWAALTTGGAR